MCLILIALDSHPDYSLIVAANRDEFYDRPSAAAGLWSDSPEVLGGRDLKAGGTWLGIDRSGRFALQRLQPDRGPCWGAVLLLQPRGEPPAARPRRLRAQQSSARYPMAQG